MVRPAMFALIALAASQIATAEPRGDVEAMADLIEANYYDPARAASMAGGLRRSAKAGDFDRFTDPQALAIELSRQLRELDGHFNVSWSAPGASAPARPGSSLPESRSNYGFTRVERLHGNVATIELLYAAHIDFADQDSPSRRAADAALAMSREADAVIIDLRRNGGGSPAMVGYLVSAFVPPDADVYNTFHSREGTQSERPEKTYTAPMLSTPLYILTSGRTGSAAEAIAFTLQSAGRAVVVGERSGGAANPGGLFRTPQGYTLFISTGSPRNPLNGRNWEGSGVKPDVEVAAGLALDRARELALEQVLKGSIAGIARTDAQWALDALKSRVLAVEPPKDVTGRFGPYELSVDQGVLKARRARWPVITLRPLQEDLYYFEHDPARRVRLERIDGKVAAITLLGPEGNSQRLSR